MKIKQYFGITLDCFKNYNVKFAVLTMYSVSYIADPVPSFCPFILKAIIYSLLAMSHNSYKIAVLSTLTTEELW